MKTAEKRMPRQAGRARRGLRVLAWAGCTFVLAQLVGGLLLDYRWPDVRFPQVGRVSARLKARPQEPEIVFMGSSRFQAGIQEGVLDPLLRDYTRQAPRAFNASVGAGDPIVAERLLDRMLREGRRPDLLVLEISPEHLNRRSPLLGQQVIRQMTWADLPQYLPDVCLYTPIMRLLSSRLVPLYVHRYQIRKQTIGALVPCLPNADLEPAPVSTPVIPEPKLRDLPPAAPPLSGPRISDDCIAAGRGFLTSWLKDYKPYSIATSALERLLDRCRTERIDVLLVGVPVMANHRDLYTPAIYAAYLTYVHSLEASYACRFVDLRDKVPDAGFQDYLHMSAQGGDYFSRVLAREALVPFWRERHP